MKRDDLADFNFDDTLPAGGVTDYAEINKLTKDEPAFAKRIPTEQVTTEEMALEFFYLEVCRRYRFLQYENALENLDKEEIYDAITDALEEINEYPPRSQRTLLDFVKLGIRYRRLLIMGAARNAVSTLVSIWTSNGIDVSVEDLSVSSKLGDFQSLLSTLTEQFEKALTEMKQKDKLCITSFTYSTGGRRFPRTTSFSTRISNIRKSGGFIR